MVIYADVLLLVNFSMDLLTLYAAGKLTHKRMRKWRVIIASAVGSILATVSTVILDESTTAAKLVSVLTALAASVIMARISYGNCGTLASLLRDSVIIWGAGALLGGIMTVILSLGESVMADSPGNYPTVFALCAVSAFGMIRFIASSKSQISSTVTITTDGKTYEISALCDTGSFAADPITGQPVILVKSGAMPEIAGVLYSDGCVMRIRMIPIDSVGGAKMLRGFVPDKVAVGGLEVSAVIAIDLSKGNYRGYEGLVPAALCK